MTTTPTLKFTTTTVMTMTTTDDNANNSDNDDVDIDSLPTEVELLCVVDSSASKHLTSHPCCHQASPEYELYWDSRKIRGYATTPL